MSILYPHIIPVHLGGEDADRFRLWLEPGSKIKVLTTDQTIPRLDLYPPGVEFVIRNYNPVSELDGQRGLPDEHYARTKAVEHAVYYEGLAQWAEAHGVARNRLIFEGINEPNLWASEPPAMVAAYYHEFTLQMHARNLRVCVGNFGVGWPGNDGPDRPPLWDFFKIVIDALWPGDFLGLHEYWWNQGPEQLWRWWAGRFLQCPYNVPILMTEAGIDGGVAGAATAYSGWRDLPESTYDAKAARYVAELLHYERLCLADPRVKGLFIFTYDMASEHWQRFNIRDGVFMAAFLPHVHDNDNFVPARTFADMLRAAFGSKFSDLRASLPVHPEDRYPTRAESTITTSVVHHSASPLNTTWDAVARYHVQSRDWPGVAYHIGIAPDGKVAYLGDLSTIRWHASPANNYSVGICCIGNYETDTPTADMLNSLTRVRELLDEYLGRTLIKKLHRDVSMTTVCPGLKLVAVLQAPVTPPPPPEPEPATVVWETQVRTAPQAGGNWFDGMVTLDGQPVDGAKVVFSWQSDGIPATQPAITGPHEGYQGWARGYYSHIINAPTPAAGDWYVWLVDAQGQRYTPIAHFATTGPGSGPNQAVVNFIGRTTTATEPLPEDETATDAPTLADKSRWWTEEATRQLEAGNQERALAILHSLTRLDRGLFYRLERLIKQ